MSKFVIRLTVIFVSIYMIVAYLVYLLFGINIWSHTYTVLFELCVCICISAQGTYHCKYIKWTAYGICVSDTMVSIDELFDIFPYTIIVYLPAIIVATDLFITTYLALRHFYRVSKINRKRRQ